MTEPRPDRLRDAAPAFDDVEARRARAGVAAALFGAAPASEAARPERVTVGRYEIRSRLGAGGMGVVYRAHDPDLDRPVAVKLVHHDAASDDKARARMLREARALAKLSHPNVITVYDVGTDGEQVFVAMELVAGPDLRRWLADHPRADWRAILRLFVAAGEGLAAAHEAAIVHRDFKPDNVLVGEDGRVRVLDFGLARAHTRAEGPTEPSAAAEPAGGEAEPASLATLRLSAGLTETGAVLGTPLYMAPELHAGKPADERSDQFAFCASLYEGVYRQLPFGARTLAAHVEAVTAGRVAAPPEDSTVPAALFELLVQGLAADPLARHPDMRSLLTALGRVEAGAAAPGRVGAVGSTSVRRRVGLVVALAVVGAAALASAWLDPPDPADPPAPPSDTRVDVAPTPLPAAAPLPSSGSEGSSPVPPVHTPVEPDERPPATEPEADPAAAAAGPGPGPSDPPPSDWCHLHEDHFTLLARTSTRRARLLAEGLCYACRVERRSSRTRNFTPRDCAGYSLCGPTPREDCP